MSDAIKNFLSSYIVYIDLFYGSAAQWNSSFWSKSNEYIGNDLQKTYKMI